jgi:uncharacterized protein YnzC (UPF0291/DUF896 family)
MDAFNSFLTFLVDKTRRPSHKVLMVLSAFLLLLFINNLTGFTYYYNNRNKIEQINQISRLLHDSTLSQEEIAELKDLRRNILKYRSMLDATYNWISTVSFTNESEFSAPNQPEVNKYSSRNSYWHFLSASWPWIFAMLGLPFAAIADKKSPLWQNILILIFAEMILWAIAWGYAKLLSLIPIILDNSVYNYALNILISIILGLIVYLNRKK